MTSTIRDVKVDREAPIQLHEQVAGEIRRAIAEGQARPGERLPPARDLAEVLGVNTNTVFRALRQLRDEGLLEFRRGRGTVSACYERADDCPATTTVHATYAVRRCRATVRALVKSGVASFASTFPSR